MTTDHPGEVEHYSWYAQHTGPRFHSTGLGIAFHYNQPPGIHFKTSLLLEYQAAIVKGIEDGLAECFPDFPSTGSIWISKASIDDVHSSQTAFYRVALLVIRQAKALMEISDRTYTEGAPSLRQT
jgi:hypothetical protein